MSCWYWKKIDKTQKLYLYQCTHELIHLKTHFWNVSKAGQKKQLKYYNIARLGKAHTYYYKAHKSTKPNFKIKEKKLKCLPVRKKKLQPSFESFLKVLRKSKPEKERVVVEHQGVPQGVLDGKKFSVFLFIIYVCTFRIPHTLYKCIARAFRKKWCIFTLWW